ncbi:YifB family Mg chelatase-like AAA ATPase [Swingsia samuiensis]|uniref:ATP-binding protein n=1 Tax=Swingsia samuiensis TaxID=1293412 RepID=A0A4Y6UIB5_9PROT|nr:YifB family Mg chelatase-like AAA ATPase [Swingsia samuiensis]QDH16186.1 ATP-binding protein [Swingsia samuiensis]
MASLNTHQPIISRIQSFTFCGIIAVPVTVEVQIATGLPAFQIVGLADKSVGESRERVRAALLSMGLSLPPKRILINLVPADLPKEGAHFDLPIAIALLVAMGIIPFETVSPYAAIGELSLDGNINATRGVLSASLTAFENELGLICPSSQGSEARWGNPNYDVLAPQSLNILLAHFRGEQVLRSEYTAPILSSDYGPDLSEIKGMALGRRALEIAAAGGHSLLMNGPPGAGKSMLASRLPSILPDLNSHEILETSRIHSLSSILKNGHLITRPPYRAPHHSASLAALVGGGAKAKPGEVSLANHGVLFLDELPEFSRSSLEALRQPIETGTISLARAAHHTTYPARFQLIAAMNPCRCGYLGDAEKLCRKAPRCGEDYTAKISGPMIDRIDLHVSIKALSAHEMSYAPRGEDSATVRARVETARTLALNRQNCCNAQASPDVFEVDDDARSLTIKAAEKIRLSNRGMTRLMRVSRTIADLDGAQNIQRHHVAEAISFRHRSSIS